MAGILANKRGLSWETKNGTQTANFYGSFTQCATCHAGFKFDDKTKTLSDVYKPIKSLLPMVDPCEFVINGWDISNENLYKACKRAKVLEPDLIRQLKPELEAIVPMPAALNGDYIAANQSERSNNLIQGSNQEIVNKLRRDI